MSHQLIGKKWRFEIPPLNWKAPDANKDADIDAAAADGDNTEEADTPRGS